MNAIFIDAKNKTVSMIEVENDLQAMYDKIGCLLVQTVPFAGENIVCDEEASDFVVHGLKIVFDLDLADGLVFRVDKDGIHLTLTSCSSKEA